MSQKLVTILHNLVTIKLVFANNAIMVTIYTTMPVYKEPFLIVINIQVLMCVILVLKDIFPFTIQYIVMFVFNKIQMINVPNMIQII